MTDKHDTPQRELSHAITQLRWLVENDFAERHGSMTSTREGLSRHWWQSATRREDMAKLRSYINGIRVLEGSFHGR